MVATLATRSEFFECLLSGVPDKPTLADALSLSRPTVDRVLREFAESGLVESSADGVAPTLLAALLYEEYRAFERGVGAIHSNDERRWQTDAAYSEVLGLVADRLDLLECVWTTPLDKRSLVAELDSSRSTVDRAVRELEVAGLVAWTKNGYATTPAGRKVTEQYRETLSIVADILTARDVLDTLPFHCSIQPELLAGVDVESVGEVTYRPPEGVRERIESADRVRVLLPVLATPQLLDSCHRAVIGGTTVELLTSPDLFETLKTEFPGPLSEMATESCTVVVEGDLPPFGLVLADTDGETTVSVVAYREQGTIHGVLHNDIEAAVQWGEERYTHHYDEATDATDELRGLAPSGTENVGLSTVNDPERVAREATGFVQLTAEYFARRTPAPPRTGWRTGFDLVDVHAGYAIDREEKCENGRQNLTDELTARLGNGANIAVLGPPGSGKSTVCKSVACRWYEQGKGPVFYRESSTGTTFDSPPVLGAHLRETDGHALVVVEDAVRAEANSIFRLMKSFRGDSNVAFLLDAREGEWNDPDALPIDAGLEAYRTEAVETVSVPELDEPERERFRRQFEATTGSELDRETTELFGETMETPKQTEMEHSPDELLLFLHQLVLSADPLAGYDARTPTTLVEDAQRTYEDLRAIGDTALDVSVLVNVLNTAGIGVYPDLVHALADETETGDDEDGFDRVRDALSLLDGQLIFEREESHGTGQYRTVHETWSALFLSHLLDAEGDRAASRRFGRCVTALLSLADDEAKRERIASAFLRSASAVERIAEAPGEWADVTVEKLFDIGLQRRGLAPLFGTSDDAAITLPESCSVETTVGCTKWRARMSFQRGHLDRAEREYEQLADLADDVEATEPELAARLRGRRFNALGTIAWRRGEFDTAEEHYTQGLGHYRDAEDTLRIADTRTNLGLLAYLRGDLDTATASLARSLETYRDLGHQRAEAAGLFNLGSVVESNGELRAAIDYYRESLSRYREVGDRREEADCFDNLGAALAHRGDLDTAATYCTRALERYREAGVRDREANALDNLGSISRVRGDFETAAGYYETSLDIRREVGDRRAEARSHTAFSRLARERGDLDIAREHCTESLDILWGIGDQIGEAESLTALAEVAFRREDLDTAMECAKEALTLHDETGHAEGEAACRRLLGMVAHERGDLDTAEDHLTRALAFFDEAGYRYEEATTHAALAPLESSRGEVAAAREALAAAIETYRDIGAVRDIVETAERLAETCEEAGDLDAALAHCETARNLGREATFDVKSESIDERHDRLTELLADEG